MAAHPPTKRNAVAYRHIEVAPLTPTIGAVVHGVSLAAADDAALAEIHAAWMAHLVLFFRQQTLTPAEHLALGRRFGPLHTHPAAPYAHGDPALMVIRTDAASKRNNGAGWHSDVSADERPPLGTILHLHEVPPAGDRPFLDASAGTADEEAPAAAHHSPAEHPPRNAEAAASPSPQRRPEPAPA